MANYCLVALFSLLVSVHTAVSINLPLQGPPGQGTGRRRKLGGVDIFNMKDYGAVGNGHTNDTQAFIDVFSNCSRASTVFYTELYVPDSRYLLYPITINFCHDCVIRVHGSILGPTEVEGWGEAHGLITFNLVHNLTVTGDRKGEIDGRGRHGERHGAKFSFISDLQEDIPLMFHGPALILFAARDTSNDYTQSAVSNITLRDAPGVHVLNNGQPLQQGVTFEDVHIRERSTSSSCVSKTPVHGVVATNSSR